MNETEITMVTVPLSDFTDGVMAKADLDSVRALVSNGREYCSDAIRAVLGIPSNKKEKLGYTEGEENENENII